MWKILNDIEINRILQKFKFYRNGFNSATYKFKTLKSII